VFVATQIANTAPHPIAKLCGVPVAADTVLFKALSKNPSQRFDDCEQFGAALAEALVPTPRTTQPPVPVVLRELPEPPPRRSRLGGGLSAMALLGVGAWLGIRLFTPNTPDSPTAEPVLPLAAQVEQEVPAVAWLSERRRQPGKDEDEELTEDNVEESEAPPDEGGGGAATTKPVLSTQTRSAASVRKGPKPRTAKAPRVPSQAP
jgi:hypothetical protein